MFLSKYAVIAVPVAFILVAYWLLKENEKGEVERVEEGYEHSDPKEDPSVLRNEEVESPSRQLSSNSGTCTVCIKAAGKGRGRGLFTNKTFKLGEIVLRIRPALTVLFHPFCSTHCAGCFVDLHSFPGLQCVECERFAVCKDCDEAFDLYEWHKRGECRRWLHLDPRIRNQERVDVLWLLIRYRAACDEDMDFTQVTNMISATNLSELAAATKIADDAGSGKESLAELKDLLGNNAELPADQVQSK